MSAKDGLLVSRDDMLARIRRALGKQAPAGIAPPPLADFDAGQTMQPIGSEEILPRFEAELQALAGTAHRAAGPESLDQALRSILGGIRKARVVLSKNPILETLRLRERLSALAASVAVWPRDSGKAAEDSFREACFNADIGITGVEYALAETGSLVLASLTEGSQLSSLAPPVHVALYRRNQLRASLDEVLDKLPVSPGSAEPSPGRSVVFVTGPSRTADIEQILIRGVHGPREVHAILVEDACLESAPPAR